MPLKKGDMLVPCKIHVFDLFFSFSLLSYSGQSRKKALTARCEASKTRLPLGRPKSSKSSFLGRFVDETKGPTKTTPYSGLMGGPNISGKGGGKGGMIRIR